MGMKPVCLVSGLLVIGLALPGCESCNCWGSKGHSTVPPGYAAATPPASTKQATWDNRATAGTTSVPVTRNTPPPASPVVRTSAETVPALPPQPTKEFVKKPLSDVEPTVRTTVPPNLNAPPPTDPPAPLPTLESSGPSLSPPPLQSPASQPPAPSFPSRPMPPE
jgi:hypothetical protein